MEIPRFPVPVVIAIIERQHEGETEVLVQTRWKPDKDPKYTGTMEITAGTLEMGETIYAALEREVLEETGLKIIEFTPKVHTQTHLQRGDDSWAFVPFCCVQQTRELNRVGFVFLCRVEDKEPAPQEGEVSEIQWMKKNDLEEIFLQSPEKLFTFELGALDYYFNWKE